MEKILYIVSTLKRSGPINVLYNICKTLDKNRFEINLITLSPEPLDSRWLDFQKLGVCLNTLGLSRLKGLFLLKKRLKTMVAEINPDIIHTHGIRADFLNFSILGEYPSLCTAHNYPCVDYPLKFGNLRGRFMAWQHFSAFRKLNLVACSQTIQRQLGEHGIDASVVQNGIDTEIFKPVSAKQKSSLRKDLGLPQDAIVILSVGSLIPRKDMQTLIAAYLLGNFENTRLVVLGDGPQRGMLQQRAESAVLMPGNVDNVADYLGAADLFVSASLAEGLPNTVLEAMACGLPCVLSDIPSHRELFEGGGGLFFSCGDVNALIDCLAQVKADQMADLGRRSRQIVEERFSAFTMSWGYQSIYEKLIEA